VLGHAELRGDLRRAAIACAFLGNVARASGQWDAAESWHQRAAAYYGQLGSVQGVAWTQHDLGLLARDRGDLAGAVGKLRSSLRDFREQEYPWAVASSAWGLATALSAQDAIDEASRLLDEALRIYQDFDDIRGVAQCLEALALIASERAHYETAARLIGAASAHRARLAVSLADAEQARISAVESAVAQALGPDLAERLRQAGWVMPAQLAAQLGTAVSSGAAPSDPDRDRPVALTRRERQVAALVASGRTNRQIGRVLGISEKTAEVHLQHVMSKLDARSRAEVAAWAATHQLPAADGLVAAD
jgi:non-specific serine/threonine protein kinase